MAFQHKVDKPVPEGVGHGFFTEIFGENGLPIDPADFSHMTVRIVASKSSGSWHLDQGALIDVVATPESILNSGRGTLVSTVNDKGEQITLLTIIFKPSDSRLVTPDGFVQVTPRLRRKGEYHLAIVEGKYPIEREFVLEIEWPVVDVPRRVYP